MFKLSIGARVTAGFILMLALMAGIGLAAWIGFQTLNEGYSQAMTGREIDRLLLEVRSLELVNTGDQETVDKIASLIDSAVNKLQSLKLEEKDIPVQENILSNYISDMYSSVQLSSSVDRQVETLFTDITNLKAHIKDAVEFSNRNIEDYQTDLNQIQKEYKLVSFGSEQIAEILKLIEDINGKKNRFFFNYDRALEVSIRKGLVEIYVRLDKYSKESSFYRNHNDSYEILSTLTSHRNEFQKLSKDANKKAALSNAVKSSINEVNGLIHSILPLVRSIHENSDQQAGESLFLLLAELLDFLPREGSIQNGPTDKEAFQAVIKRLTAIKAKIRDDPIPGSSKENIEQLVSKTDELIDWIKKGQAAAVQLEQLERQVEQEWNKAMASLGNVSDAIRNIDSDRLDALAELNEKIEFIQKQISVFFNNREIALDINAGLVEVELLARHYLSEPVTSEHYPQLLRSYHDRLDNIGVQAGLLQTKNGQNISSSIKEILTSLASKMQTVAETRAQQHEISLRQQEAAQAVSVVAGKVVAASSKEIERSGNTALWVLLGGLLISSLTGLVTSTAISRSVKQPLVQMVHAMEAIASNELDTKVPGLDRHDEFRQFAGALEVFKSNMLRIRQLETQFEGRVLKLIDGLAESGQVVHNECRQVGEIAKANVRRSSLVIDEAGMASNSVGSVKDAASEFQSILHEVTDLQKSVLSSTGKMAGVASDTGNSIKKLTSAADEIGSVVNVILGIASRTNLLSLNASIAAKRAGDAGAEFSVVAREVRHLASRSADAARLIEENLQNIHKAAGTARNHLNLLDQTVADVKGFSDSVLSATETQDTACNKIVDQTFKANSNVQSVTQSIQDMAKAEQQNKLAAHRLDGVIISLKTDTLGVQLALRQFLEEVRSA